MPEWRLSSLLYRTAKIIQCIHLLCIAIRCSSSPSLQVQLLILITPQLLTYRRLICEVCTDSYFDFFLGSAKVTVVRLIGRVVTTLNTILKTESSEHQFDTLIKWLRLV